MPRAGGRAGPVPASASPAPAPAPGPGNSPETPAPPGEASGSRPPLPAQVDELLRGLFGRGR